MSIELKPATAARSDDVATMLGPKLSHVMNPPVAPATSATNSTVPTTAPALASASTAIDEVLTSTPTASAESISPGN